MAETVAIMVVVFWGGMIVGWLFREQIAWAEWLTNISHATTRAVDATRREFNKGL